MDGKRAYHYFNNGYLCAESVLLATTDAMSINNPGIPAIATGFCSGASRTKGVCGALQGAILAISVIHGRTSPEQEVDICYSLIQELTDYFNRRNESLNCFEITGCDLGKPQGQTKFKENNIKQQKCLPIVEDITDFTITLLRDQK
ncbi:C-GCAxxG-C-C family protein [Desulfovibrio sp. JC010]|uniref:C-GCAxxG-C-C family protein n=1 Tax=Desulfovibrio sp. JC010 TaxID=2593641 RepID=UPI0013D8B725|nr:C-GCAxxG-C-C family protein [Desulfovibrio sp. JC010]NDV28320.1 C_GCAxxG_C_C family protein [Desulfovibrio sp. JC010]